MENNKENNNKENNNKVEDTVNKVADELEKGFKGAYEEVKKEAGPAYEEAKKAVNDVDDHTSEFTKEEIENGKGMAVLSYIGILCLIPYFAEKNNKYVIFHAKEGLNLFLLSVIAGTVSSFLVLIPLLGLILVIVPFAVSIMQIVLMVLGIVNVANGQAKELPIINKFKIIK